MSLDQERALAVIGLGYVGLPLAAEFGKRRSVIGFDLSEHRVAELRAGRDSTRELSDDELAGASGLTFSTRVEDLAPCNTYIVTVPTPVDAHKRPDLTSLLAASAMIGSVLERGDLVIYESTVYPGATEEECAPVLEERSGLVLNDDFFLGYSPERINPGDRERRLTDIVKVTSGSTLEAAQVVDSLYREVISAGTHLAPSIKVAEAAKVIENTQRDLNIALVNELAIIFHRLEIDTTAVLRAAATKWNFLPFRPGLVGGHCVGVDPYYLTHKAQSVGYHPEIILAGRRLNDAMGSFVVSRLVKAMIRRRIQVDEARILVLGLAFKENVTDLRNTRVIDVIRELEEYNANVSVHDPRVDPAEADAEYAIKMTPEPELGSYDAIIVAVAHAEFLQLGTAGIRSWGKTECVVFDLTSALGTAADHLRL